MLRVQTQALVLRSLNFGESDRIITLLGADVGKVSALARGARRSVRRFTGLGSAALGLATLHERGGDLWSLEAFDVIKPRTELALDLVTAAHAAYACELVERLCASHQADAEIFVWLDQMLDLLTQRPPAAERLRAFELGLLQRLGLGLGIDRCEGCGRRDMAHTGGRWLPDAMVLLCAQCGTRGVVMDAAAVAALVRLTSVPLGEAEQHALSAAVNRACRNLLAPFIEHHVGGPLKSLQFLIKLARGPAVSTPARPSANHQPANKTAAPTTAGETNNQASNKEPS